MITITNLAMNYGTKLLFANVNLNLNPGDRYGLVGANGAGKSTFFKLILGEEEHCMGEISISKHARVGWLKQDHYLYENHPLLECVIMGREPLWNAMEEKKKLLEGEITESVGYRLGELEQIIYENDGYDAESFAGKLLSGLGIKESQHFDNLSTLSGGYKLRVLLAQSLFNNPDILLLDEPTNHLDIISIYWLENYLKFSFKGVLVFISHDVAFINNVSTHILDIDYGDIQLYHGNYDKFNKEKTFIMEQKLGETKSLERKIAQMQMIVDKFRAGTRAKQAQSREKQIDKIELPDIQKSSRLSPFFRFTVKRPSGKGLLRASGICKSYEDKKVLNYVSFPLERGEKIVIIGPNGIGKSTLLKIIMGKLAADQGTYEWGYESNISYFAQDHHDSLNQSCTVLEWLTDATQGADDNAIRATLGQMLFPREDAHKNVLTLSGGECARLLIARVILEQGNVLVMDEPTNHLDIESKEALKKALLKYEGTLILVTHDRDFASGIATRVLALSEQGVTDFHGSYDEYLAKHGKDYLSSNWLMANK